MVPVPFVSLAARATSVGRTQTLPTPRCTHIRQWAATSLSVNVGRFLSGDHAFVQKDIEAVVAEAKKRGALVKVILETCWLSPEEIARACKIAEAAGADFVKTSTGFGDGPATPEAVDVMIRTVGKTMGVKASGGVRTWETAVGYLQQGCKRLGVASTEAVLDGAPE